MKKKVAIITARGGSKRIPRKNIRPFLGRPIIYYSIKAALESGVFDEVMVSTDDEEIAGFARTYGANVPFMRSKANSDNHSTTVNVLVEVLEQYSLLGLVFDTYCCIYPTAPFVTPEKIRHAHELLEKNSASSVVTVVRYGYPIQRALQIQDGHLSMIDSRHINSRSQDLKPTYHDCGQLYVGNVSSLLSKGQIFTEKTIPFLVPETEVQDIDEEEDWVIAELKIKLLIDQGKL